MVGLAIRIALAINTHPIQGQKCHRAGAGNNNSMYGKKHTSETVAEYSLTRSGEKNHQWKGGISAEPYCFEWSFQEFKDMVKDRDDNKCQNPICHRNSKRLHIHHINYDKKDCRIDNLITVCNSCNSRANKNRDKWQAHYAGLIKAQKIKVAEQQQCFA
ncbi:hypothetical protein LCGC14_2493530 [marine sediment metagenome]|uniref:HNH nuclease domain-containing protein n=1 Tax=marine sediment metagenome TaxID=412755 RepID=A0A0F9BRZ1_9ZZZZ